MRPAPEQLVTLQAWASLITNLRNITIITITIFITLTTAITVVSSIAISVGILPVRPFAWVAAKERKVSYWSTETVFIYPGYGQ